MTVETTTTQQEATFDAITIIKSAKYKRYADILCFLLNEGEAYTHKQIDTLLNKALKQQVSLSVNSKEVN